MYTGPAQMIPKIARITGVVDRLEVAREAAKVVYSVYSDDLIGALEMRPKTPFLGNLGRKLVSGGVTFFGDFRLFGRASRSIEEDSQQSQLEV